MGILKDCKAIQKKGECSKANICSATKRHAPAKANCQGDPLHVSAMGYYGSITEIKSIKEDKSSDRINNQPQFLRNLLPFLS